jgi:hypothetical protein
MAVTDDGRFRDPPDGYCLDGQPHLPVVTGEQGDVYDPEVLGTVPNPALWGYCPVCWLGFRWSITDQRWRRWPGSLAMLPMLDDEELEELYIAVTVRSHALRVAHAVADTEISGLGQSRAEVTHHLALLRSLSTAIAEARSSTHRADPDSAEEHQALLRLQGLRSAPAPRSPTLREVRFSEDTWEAAPGPVIPSSEPQPTRADEPPV